MNDGTIKIGTELDQTGMKKGLDGLGGYAQKGFGVIGTAAKAMAGVAVGAIAAVGASMGAAVVAGFNYNKQMENYMASFTTMLGDEATALAKVDELKKLAASTPYEMGDLADGTKTLLAFGVANKDTTKDLTMLGDISLGNVEKLKSLTMAFGKASSQGKMTGENLQMMIEAGFNPLPIIAKKTGESIADLTVRMSKGGISADEMTAAFKTATSEGGQFYKGMEIASKTTDGLISTLKDNANALLGQVMEPISVAIKDKLIPAALSAIDKLTKGFTKDGVPGLIKAVKEIAPVLSPVIDLFTWIIDNGDTIARVVGVVASAYAGYQAVLIVTTAIQYAQIAAQEIGNALMVLSAIATDGVAAAQVVLAGATGGATAAQWLLNAAMNANPIGIVIGLVAALVAAYLLFGNQTDEATKKSQALIDKSKEAAKACDDTTAAFKNQNDEIDTNTALEQKLTDKLYSLSEKENKSNTEKKEMTSLVSQLNDLMPDLNLTIDEQTGAINKNKTAVDSYIKSKTEEIKLKAREDRLLELYKENITITDDLTEAQDALNAAYKAGQDIHMADEQIKEQKTYIAAKKAVDILTVAMDENITKTKELENAYGIAASALPGYYTAATEAAKGVIKANELIVDSETETVALTQDQLDQQQKDREEVYAAMEQATKDYYNAMGTIEDDGIEQSKTTAAKAKENLDKQAEDYLAYEANLEALSSRVTPTVLAQLKDLGPKYSSMLAELNGYTDTELQAWVNTWTNKGSLAESAADATFAAIYKAYGDPYTTFYGMGQSSIDGLIAGMKANTPGAYTAATEAAKGVAKAYKDAQKQKSPSKVWRDMGKMDMRGLTGGYKDMEPQLKATAMKTASLTTGSMVSEMQGQAYGRSQGMSVSTAAQTATNNQSAFDYKAQAKANAEAINGMKVEMDGQTVGHMVAPYIDEEMGSMSSLKARYA